MPYLAALLGIALVLATLLDAFEVVLLPRPVRHRVRMHRYFFMGTWAVWSRSALRLPPGHSREDFIGVYGPLSMVMLFTLWAVCLIVGFGLLQWVLQAVMADGPSQSLGREMILSGDAFFTLGYGDIVPRNVVARLMVILESGTGFGFIALTVGYLPVLYQHFARRDVQLIEFAARAGSPPTASTLLQWHAAKGDPVQLDQWLRDWERWADDLIESHSTYPMLAFYRSQHDGYSWLASLAVVLDACTLIIAASDRGSLLQAEATFSAARRVLDEVSSSLGVAPARANDRQRLEPRTFTQLGAELERLAFGWRDDDDTARLMTELRSAYEPQLGGLSTYLLLPLPDWSRAPTAGAEGFGREEVVERLVRRTGANE